MSSQRKIGRRAFLASTAAAATGYAVGGKVVFARRRSANEMVNVGLMVVAVCDCFKPRVDAFVSNVGKGRNFKGYVDFRKMIEKENLDGVMIETTTHARAWVTCHAMAMGVDAYIEKPMCLTVAEGRHMVDIARKYKRVTQVGTQQRSIPLNNWASDLVKNGAIGKVKEVLAPNFVGPIRWTPKPAQPMPPIRADFPSASAAGARTATTRSREDWEPTRPVRSRSCSKSRFAICPAASSRNASQRKTKPAQNITTAPRTNSARGPKSA